MKTKTVILILLLLSFFACKTRKAETDMDRSKQSETSLVESGQREKSGDVSGSASVKTEMQTERTEHRTGGSIHLSDPDSAGVQYPVVIEWYSNEIAETSKESSEIEALYQQRIKTLEKEKRALQQQLELEINEKTVTKSGFTFLEKTGIVAIAIIVLYIIFRTIKFYLKFRK